jgi:transposase InsO family protein
MIVTIRDQTGAGIRRICSVLGLPRSSYYQASRATKTELEDQQIGALIEQIFLKHRRRYGYRRIHDDLKDLDVQCGPARVRRIMKQRRLYAIQPKNYVPRTSDGRADQPSPNLLLNRRNPSRVNEVWIGDITFIPTTVGWRYLAVVIDLYSRRVVGWSLSDHLRADLVIEALRQALRTRTRDQQLIFHSDRGSQYGSSSFRASLRNAGITQSMSRRANPYDNAWTESFMGTLKSEMIQGSRFLDEQHARTEIFCYIDGYYNTERKHSSLGYLSPSKFESTHYEN